MPVGWAAAAGVVDAGISAYGSMSAADTQAQAAQAGINAQMNMFNETQANLLPYMQYGQTALNYLQGQGPAGSPSLNSLIQPFNPTMQQLEATPGYKFTLQQGEQSVANALSAQGQAQPGTPGAFSGPATKAAENYAEGLASTTYNQQFQNYLTQNSQIYNMLMGAAGSGQNAAVGLGGFATQTGANNANLLTSAGAAQAAGTVGATNAISGGLSGGANNALLYSLLNNQNTLTGTGSNPMSLTNNTPNAATMLTPD